MTPSTAASVSPGPQPTQSSPTTSGYPGPLSTTPAPAGTTSAAYPGPVGTTAPAQAGASATLATGTLIASPETTSIITTLTVEPLTTITVQFPNLSPQPELKINERSTDFALEKDSADRQLDWLKRAGPLGFILVIWVILGGWFFLSLRQIQD
jgi:hypothetical protein